MGRFGTVEQLRERLVLVLLATLTLFIGISAIRLTNRHYKIAHEVDRVNEEIASLEQERQTLEQSISSLNETAIIEHNAREKLNLQKPGERVVVLLPSGQPDVKSAAAALPPPPKEPSNPEKWWTYFFGS